MSNVVVKRITDTSLLVGSKVVYKDTDQNWCAVTELSQREREALEIYLTENKEI